MESLQRYLALDKLLAALFPRYCVRCDEEGELWCYSCQNDFFVSPPLPSCPFCRRGGSLRTCKKCRSETYLDGLCAMSPYAETYIKQALRAWKYYSDRSIETAIYTWIRDAWSAIGLFGVDAVAPVPLHPRRRRFRGFDQALRLAELISKAGDIPLVNPLVRQVYSTSQAKSADHRRRLGQMDGVFALQYQPPARILICDDVFTTGTTMEAAAKVLKEGGASEVWGFALALGNPGSDP